MLLTDTLRKQHVVLPLVEDIRHHGIRTSEGRDAIRKLHRLIAAHLQLEDSKLYPALLAHPDTAVLAHTCADEVPQLSSKITTFFKAWHDGGENVDFARNHGQLVGSINQRLTRAEIRLYPAYDEHCAQD